MPCRQASTTTSRCRGHRPAAAGPRAPRSRRAPDRHRRRQLVLRPGRRRARTRRLRLLGTHGDPQRLLRDARPRHLSAYVALGRRGIDAPRLRPAFELPRPSGRGRADPRDRRLRPQGRADRRPAPCGPRSLRASRQLEPLEGVTVDKLNDQHAFLTCPRPGHRARPAAEPGHQPSVRSIRPMALDPPRRRRSPGAGQRHDRPVVGARTEWSAAERERTSATTSAATSAPWR